MSDRSRSNQRTRRAARRIDREKVRELAQQGLTPQDIAQHQGVHRTTIWRFLQQSEPERQALEQFKRTRGDVFAKLAAKSLDVQEKILDTLDDSVIGALTPSQKSGLLHVLTLQHGVLFDKERLETGQSTHNVGVLARIFGSGIQGWAESLCTSRQSAAERPENSEPLKAEQDNPTPEGVADIEDAAV